MAQAKPTKVRYETADFDPAIVAKRITAAAKLAMADAGYSRAYGVLPAQDTLFAMAGQETMSRFESYLRGAIATMMPRGWTWVIDRGPGSYVTLRITGTGEPPNAGYATGRSRR